MRVRARAFHQLRAALRLILRLLARLSIFQALRVRRERTPSILDHQCSCQVVLGLNEIKSFDASPYLCRSVFSAV